MKTYTLLAACFLALPLSAQNLPCGVPDQSIDSEMQRRAQLAHTQRIGQTPTISYIPIKMHLFGQNDDTGYASHAEINDALAQLNRYFADANIQFYFSGSFNHYPNSLFDDSQQTAQQNDDFHLSNAATDAINVYMSRVLLLNGSGVAGYAYVGQAGPSAQFYNRIWLASPYSGAIVHEMGHFMGLHHTFNNSTNADWQQRERVTRNFSELPPRLSANCEDTGDYICDTASDPYGNPNTEYQECLYIGTATDINSDLFAPGPTNVMAYAGCAPAIFTPGQYARIDDTLLLYQSPANGFTLTAPETSQPAPTNLSLTFANAVYNSPATLSWQDNSAVETGYIIEMSQHPDGPFVPFIGVAENTTSISNFAMAPNIPHYFRIKASNTKAAYSTISGPFQSSSLCGNNAGATCEFNADPALASWQIRDFSLSRNGAPLISNLNSGCSSGGMGNYYDTHSAVVIPGESLDFTVASRSGTDGAYSINVKIYADWNRDNDFDDSGELLFNNGMDYLQTSGSLSIPNALVAGDYRMRVSLTSFDPGEASTACGYIWGEMEDYKLSNTALGVADFAHNQALSIYPNPSKDVLFLRVANGDTIEAVGITDPAGKKIHEQRDPGDQIDIAHLASGMYFIQVIASGKKITAKFLKL